MIGFTIALLILAFGCFALIVTNIAVDKMKLLGLGLALWVASILIGYLK